MDSCGRRGSSLDLSIKGRTVAKKCAKIKIVAMQSTTDTFTVSGVARRLLRGAYRSPWADLQWGSKASPQNPEIAVKNSH